MTINEKWTDKVTLIELEGDTTEPTHLKVVWATFKFYDCEYIAAISPKDIEEDIPRTCLEGDSILFDSFESFIEEEENWKKLKNCFFRYLNYLNEMENEN